MDITNQNHDYLHQNYETNGHTTLNIQMEID
jgi:hypothetical protein